MKEKNCHKNVGGKSSWKKREVRKVLIGISEVGKFPIKSGTAERSWKVFNVVLSNQKLSNFGSKFPTSFFPIQFRTFQLLVFPNEIQRNHTLQCSI